MTHSDRRDVGVLALLALAWGLVAAPLLHTIEHAHGHSHHHGAPSPRSHDGQNLEHFTVVALTVPQVSPPVFVATLLARPRFVEPEHPWLTPRRSSEEPQGP